MRTTRFIRNIPGVLIATIACLAAAGCGPRAAVTLGQPFAPPAQRQLELNSVWAYSSATGSTREFLLAFPLPGAKDGPRDFVIYIQTPDRTGTFVLDPEQAEAPCGFLIQSVGQLAGKTHLAGGTVQVEAVPLSPTARVLKLSLLCEDSSAISGSAVAIESGDELRRFGRKYAGDLAALRPAAPHALAEQTGESELLSGGSETSRRSATTP